MSLGHVLVSELPSPCFVSMVLLTKKCGLGSHSSDKRKDSLPKTIDRALLGFLAAGLYVCVVSLKSSLGGTGLPPQLPAYSDLGQRSGSQNAAKQLTRTNCDCHDI